MYSRIRCPYCDGEGIIKIKKFAKPKTDEEIDEDMEEIECERCDGLGYLEPEPKERERD